METHATLAPMRHDSLEEHRRAIFGLCYRMVGSAADAEDLVQDTFRRAIERPPKDRDAPIRPWLMRVATNLAIDALRKRTRRRYFGPWLPSPVPTGDINEPIAIGPDARYELLESASMAFLIALEALDERQRAVIVLRDVLGASGPETAAILDESPANVRVIFHRARAALRAYDESRIVFSPEHKARTGARLRQLVVALAMGQTQLALELLSDDVVSVHDSAGDAIAAVIELRGRERVVEVYRAIAAQRRTPIFVHERELNGLPALVMLYPDSADRYAKRAVFSVELDDSERIVAIRVTVANRKLTRISFPE